ncbi:MAG: Hsp70 family protein, partial [Methylococcales bacterium]|nr:Hsp70 family protein [Methylococcales bacterium]
TAADNQPSVEIHVLQGERPMANQNKSIGKFHLDGIPPSPRGVPQIEVTFDIDANGILNVSAKDKATGKEQSIVIKASSGLSDDEVDRMIKDAEAHADEDKKVTELVSARNSAESMVNATKKTLEEFGEQVTEDEKTAIEAAIAEVEEALKGDDKDIIDAKTATLTELSGKLAERVYAEKASADGSAGAESDANSDSAAADDVVDAEFEEVKDDDKK